MLNYVPEGMRWAYHFTGQPQKPLGTGPTPWLRPVMCRDVFPISDGSGPLGKSKRGLDLQRSSNTSQPFGDT